MTGSEAVAGDRRIRSRVSGRLRVRNGHDGRIRLTDRWWAPLAGVTAVVVVFFTMPEWMPASGFLSTSDGVIVSLYTMLALGMVLVLGYCGQLMLSVNVFYGIGSYGLAILALHQGLNPWIGLVASMVIVGLVALLLGILVFRLKGNLLGLVTLLIGYVGYVVFNTSSVTGGAAGMSAGPSLSIGSISLASGSNALFYVSAGAAVVSLVLIRNVVVSRTGRALRAVEASEAAASSAGVNATHYKVVAFVIAAMLASVAGSLFADYVGVVGSSSFNINLVVEILLIAVVGGLRSVWAAPFGVLAIVILDAALQTYGSSIFPVSPAFVTTVGYGVLLILVLLFLPGGLSSVGRWIERNMTSLWSPGQLDQSSVSVAAADSHVVSPVTSGVDVTYMPTALADVFGPAAVSSAHTELDGQHGSESRVLLEAVDIRCHFGGLLALDGVSLRLQAGQVIGIIGPNGAGKTTLFNCLSGHVLPSSGSVHINGEDVTGLRPYRIARHGLARTFQNVELFPDMTVKENVMVGSHLRGHAGSVAAMLRLPTHWRGERDLADRAMRSLELVGMARYATQVASTLTYGQERRIGIARARGRARGPAARRASLWPNGGGSSRVD